jgi:hypothetical protein
MDQQQSASTEQVFAGIQKDFVIVGKNRIGASYAWTIIGIVVAMAIAMIFVSKQSIEFGQDAGELAAAVRQQQTVSNTYVPIPPSSATEPVEQTN